MNIKSVDFGFGETRYTTDVTKTVSARAVVNGQRILADWVQHFPREENWVGREYGVPSLLVRLDCVVSPDDQVLIYEVEERPSGAGLSAQVSRSFAERFAQARKQWPEFRFAVFEPRRSFDDHVWLERRNGHGLVLIRADPGDPAAIGLQADSVSSLTSEGNKSYGVQMDLWRLVVGSEMADLPWDTGFVLKPIQGTGCRDVEIWHPRRNDYPGVSTRTRIEKTLKRRGRMYLQPFISPMESGLDPWRFMIYRIFYGYNPADRRWDCLGGLANARPCVRVHGASDTLFFPLEIQ